MFELVSSGASGVGQDKQIISDSNFDEIAQKKDDKQSDKQVGRNSS